MPRIFVPFLCCLLCLCIKKAKCQEIQNSILENDFCKPGVSHSSPGKGLLLEYGMLFNEDFYERIREEQRVGSYEVFRGKIKLPVLLQERTKILLGLNYRLDEFNFEYLNGEGVAGTAPHQSFETLRSSAINAYFIHSLNKKNYLVVRGSVASTGDYRQFMSFRERYLTYRIGALLGIKKHEDFEWGVGLGASYGFRGTRVYPFLIYNRTFNDDWGVEAVLPVSVYLRRNFQDGELLRAGFRMTSKSYALAVEDRQQGETHYNLNRMEARVECIYEKRLSGWVWMSATAGYNFGLRNRFEAPNDRRDFFSVDAQSGLYGKIGFFLSPPARSMKK